MQRDGRELENSSTKKNQQRTSKKGQKKPKKRIYQKKAYKTEFNAHTLVSKNMADWEGAEEEFYRQKSAKNLKKVAKNTKKAKIKQRNTSKSDIPCCQTMLKTWRMQENIFTDKNQP